MNVPGKNFDENLYTVLSSMEFTINSVFKFLCVLDDSVVMLYVYKKIKDRITPEINAKVEDTLDEWFGVEFELIET